MIVAAIPFFDIQTPDTTPPTIPGAFLIGAVTTSQYTITAGASTDAESPPVEYLFYKNNVAQGNWQSSNQFTETGLSAGSTADWKVKARDSASTPNESGFNTATTVGTLTVAPVLSFVGVTWNSIEVSYTDPVGRQHFVVEYKPSSQSTWQLADNSANANTYEITGLQSNTEYNVRVRTTNINGLLSSSSNILTQTTLPEEIQ